MRKHFWRANLLAALAALGLFIVAAGLFRWNLGGTILLSLGIFLALTVLLTPRTPEELQEDEPFSTLGKLENQAELLQQAALQCREAQLREAGRALYDTVKSVLDYLSVAPDKIETAKWPLQGELSAAQALLDQYLEREGGKNRAGLSQLQAKVLDAVKEMDAAFQRQFEALLQNEEIPQGQNFSLPDFFGGAANEG